jgi:hypothetical protein
MSNAIFAAARRRRARPRFLTPYARIWIFGLAKTFIAIGAVRVILGAL